MSNNNNGQGRSLIVNPYAKLVKKENGGSLQKYTDMQTKLLTATKKRTCRSKHINHIKE